LDPSDFDTYEGELMIKRFAALLVSVAAAAILLPASSGAGPASTAAESAKIGQALEAHSAGGASSSAGTHSSRWARKRPRLMTFATAKAQAWRSARLVYIDPQFTFDDYGARGCYRNSRSMARCYTFVSEDLYDEYGYFADTIICDWFTVSWWTWAGRLRVKTTSPECVLLSEL
jgi:hypothetical protein